MNVALKCRTINHCPPNYLDDFFFHRDLYEIFKQSYCKKMHKRIKKNPGKNGWKRKKKYMCGISKSRLLSHVLDLIFCAIVNSHYSGYLQICMPSLQSISLDIVALIINKQYPEKQNFTHRRKDGLQGSTIYFDITDCGYSLEPPQWL